MQTTIHKSGELIAELNERDELAAIRLLRTIVVAVVAKGWELFGAVLVGSEKEIFNQLTAKAWTVGKSAPPTNCRLRRSCLLPTEKKFMITKRGLMSMGHHRRVYRSGYVRGECGSGEGAQWHHVEVPPARPA